MAKAKKRKATRAPITKKVLPGYVEFELDLLGAVLNELRPCLDKMEAAPLTRPNVDDLPNAQGVYQLIHDGKVKYLGKTDAKAGLRARLAKHVQKLQNRHGLKPKAEPTPLEAGVTRDEYPLAAPEFGIDVNHGQSHIFHGALPLFHKSSRSRLSRSVSIGCQNP